MPEKNKGFVQPIVLILILLAATLWIFWPAIQKRFFIPAPAPTQTPAQSESPSPSPTILPSPAPSATVSPIPKATPAVISGPPGAGYYYATVHTEKGDFQASVLSIDLNSSRMITDTGNDSDCSSGCTVLPLANYVTRNGGFAGVNGSYFCPAEPAYSSCGANNSYDFPVYNTRLGHWINGGNLFWNSRAIFYYDGSGAHYLQNANSFSGGLTAGIVNYPGLVDGGNVQIDDNQSGLSDKQKSVGTKVGIGLRSPKSVFVVVAYNVNMQQFAYVFKALGASGALNLDTGGSTALYNNGYVAGPGRNIPNAIIFAH